VSAGAFRNITHYISESCRIERQHNKQFFISSSIAQPPTSKLYRSRAQQQRHSECTMADRRAVRASSRRKTPTPQPPSKPNSPQAARTTRARSTRSASRDVEVSVEGAKPARRSARQASVISLAGDSEQEGDVAPKARTKRKAPKEIAGELPLGAEPQYEHFDVLLPPFPGQRTDAHSV
jgi:hypothetical protein